MAGRTAAGQGFATFSNLEMQHSPKIFCNFCQKILAKNRAERMVEYMPTDMQYKDGLRKDKFLNDLIIEAIKTGNNEKSLEE